MKRHSRQIQLGNRIIGGDEPPLLQTMITTPLSLFDRAFQEATRALNMGCDVIRTAVRNSEDIPQLTKLVKQFPGEIIADIHFSHELALAAVRSGVSGIRINPGNIGGKDRVAAVVAALRACETTALRIGVNSGSVEKDLLARYGGPSPEAIVHSVRRWVDFIEGELGFTNFKISAKSSSVGDTLNACEQIAAFTDAPFHVGITEAGCGMRGVVKSAAGLAVLFQRGYADTFRVSLTAPVEEEIRTGYHLLNSFGFLENGIDLISCPTCGRTHGAVFDYCRRLDRWLDNNRWWEKPALSAAVMGCEVNGPGEARHADMGIALGVSSALFFLNGEIQQKFTDQDMAFERLLQEIQTAWEGGNT